MSARKQQLLKRHRRNKRIGLLVALLALLAVGLLVSPWLLPILLVALWVAHEAWFADHLFYSPGEDYRYRFAEGVESLPVRLADGRLRVDGELREGDTLVLGIGVRAGWLGRFLEPSVLLEGGAEADAQAFERGVNGLRYLNLTGLAGPLGEGRIRLRGRHCRLVGEPTLWRARHPDYRDRRVMVIAPHADDAELAAFGLYSQAREAWIVTLTAGEIETEHYRRMGLDGIAAARLKGRLRAWDSQAVPTWGGVPAERCVQLGYFCLQLPAMQANPGEVVPSREADLADIRPFRQFNRLLLASDADGLSTWNNLLSDLRELILLARPEVIVLPHPHFDPHPDHVRAQEAVREALQGLDWQPQALLHYANHLHDNDRWPMGDAHMGVSLPPLTEECSPLLPWTLALERTRQVDKAMALGMMHDLQPRPPFKRRLRRRLQGWLAGRRWPAYGEDEFMRKALLDELGGVENLLVTKTKSGEEYLRTLNRIRFFVSADVGMGEYMIKNFEAMACGCVLLAYDQGERENEALGFRDMENIVLYRSVADIQEKLAILRLDTALAERIARSGQALAIERFSFAAVGQSIVEAMRPALREPERPGWLEKTWRRIFT